MFERYMTLGQVAFNETNYIEAREHFEKAYDLKDEISANVSLVKTLIELNEFETAYSLIKEKKNYYEKKNEFHNSYFEVLLQLNLFLEIEKFLIIENLENKADYEKAYRIAKDYHLMIYKEKYKEIIDKIADLPSVKAVAQGSVLKQLVYLPKEKVIALSKELLVNEQVSLFSRSELIQQLAQIRISERLTVLTFDGKLESFIPKETQTLKEVYQTSTVLKEVGSYFEQNNPSLTLEVEKTIRVHLGCLYPFHEKIMTPVSDWVESYKTKYEMRNEVEHLQTIYNIQEKLDLEVLNLLSFH